MSVSSSTSVQILESRTLPLHTVTIFEDRAELKYVFDVNLNKGFNNLCIENVCASIEQDSIRVDGKGAAVIHEVQFKSQHATADEVNSPEVKELTKQLEELKSKKTSIEDLVQVFKSRLQSMENVAKNLGEVTIASKKGTNELIAFNTEAETTLDNFYSYQERKAVEISANIRKSTAEIAELDVQIEKLNNKLNQLRYNVPIKRSICIALEAMTDQTNTQIHLSYQVYNASWIPSFDVRVNTTGKEPQLKLIYYGNIRQNTGEDWSDVNLILSTAQPAAGGQLPQIGTLEAQFYKAPVIKPYQAMKRSVNYSAMAMPCSAPFGAGDNFHQEMAEMDVQTYKAENQVLSTTFTVPQTKSIPSDGSEHKVTIATLDFKPLLHFDCVPSKNTNVYLTASMINSSPFPLLDGQASVYVDNSFSAKISMKSVSSGEKFDLSLGVDPTIKVNYKPLHKYQQQTGVINKSSVTMREQKISIKNTKQEEPIILTFVEHIPKSTDEKIKIKVHAPELKTNGHMTSTSTEDLTKIKSPEVGARINDAHNLEWTVVLNALEEKEFVIKYGVECPPSETVEFVEKF